MKKILKVLGITIALTAIGVAVKAKEKSSNVRYGAHSFPILRSFKIGEHTFKSNPQTESFLFVDPDETF